MDKDNKPETTTTNQEEKDATNNCCEDNDICSLQDVIDGENASMDIANAVLGASDAKNCSYDSGYVYRQALYSCMTCQKNSNDNQVAGVCLACSYACHANHELVELYTKRNFRCDCGNSKFSNEFKCKLEANKESLNDLNKYNHNFKGLYCVCNKPYPPTEDGLNGNDDDDCADDEMVQCSICEDWFHFKHLIGSKDFVNTNDDFDELICHLCMKENSWLWYYQGYTAVKLDASETDTNKEVDVLNESASGSADTAVECECFLDKMKNKHKNLTIPNEKACYFLNGWRDALCKCESCMKLYENNGIKFLTNNEDTIKFYEEKGKSKSDEIDESSLIQNELSKLPHVSKIEFLHSLNDFKQELKGFLSNFANNGEIVKRENVEEFFDNLNQRKKQKLENNQTEMSYYCK